MMGGLTMQMRVGRAAREKLKKREQNSLSVQTLTFRTHGSDGIESQPIALRSAVIAGWTGRDPVAREKHIAD